MNSLALVLLLLDAVSAHHVSLLGDDSFTVREHSSAVLASLLPFSVPHLAAACRSPDPEVRRRIRPLLRDHFVAAERWLFRANGGEAPWLDCLPADWQDRQHIIDHWLNATGMDRNDGPIYAAWREATRLYVRQLLSEGWSGTELAGLLTTVTENEREMKKRMAGQRGE